MSKSVIIPKVDSAHSVNEDVESGMEITSNDPLMLNSALVQRHVILAEYAILCREPIPGIYTTPSAKEPTEWFGVLFIRYGPYAGAVLRFMLILPKNFPSSIMPVVRFEMDLFHPYVDPNSLELCSKQYFPENWKPGIHRVYHLLLVIQRMFHVFDCDSSSCVNQEAKSMLRENREAFRNRVHDVIKTSRSVIYDISTNMDENYIKFSPWDVSIHEQLRQTLVGKMNPSKSSLTTCGSLFCDVACGASPSRLKAGFSWISPAEKIYMVEKTPVNRESKEGSTNIVL